MLIVSGIVSITVSEYYRLGEQGTVRLEDRAGNQITVQVVAEPPKEGE